MDPRFLSICTKIASRCDIGAPALFHPARSEPAVRAVFEQKMRVKAGLKGLRTVIRSVFPAPPGPLPR